ncbi:lysine--tRNA ligase [bacterium (Candidatus Howlettbacteria) CG_4_10_14_0_8_um_filter_40_9]|nr:MAG: lysine--tRNA ligase [bacterium (Candidatus Howlettbacteria) CG_4_10_14_0_8_um_filter_40_9]
MSTREEQIREQRLESLKRIREKGIDPYPSKGKRTHLCIEVKNNYKSLQGKKVSVVGRIMTDRNMGKIAFFTIKDVSGTLQIVFRQDNLGKEKQKDLKIFDTGDFIEVSGTVMKTKVGEVSVDVKNFRLLAKSLMPLPDKFSGLKDEELKLRKRYLDILSNDDVRDMIVKRSRFWQAMREFMLKEGFMEVETPVLETTAGGADARPFVTHHNALDMDVYLRISAGELWQKRLMVAGLEKTFEIGRIFRNEGMSFEHLQDYTQMEFYWAYADYNDGMKTVEKLYKYLAKTIFGTYKFQIGDHKVDLGKKWEIYSYPKIIKEVTGINISDTNITEIKDKLKKLNIKYDTKGFNLIRGIDTLWKHCRKKISGPGFLIDIPVEMEPLAKRKTEDQNFVQRFQVLLAGSEMGKGYSELNDPIDQAERFASQQKMRDAGDEEAQMFDKDFIEALEIGMPPTCGFGISERLFSYLLNKPSRETQIFPLMRPDKVKETKIK